MYQAGYVVVEIQETIGQTLDAPQHGFNGIGVEGGQQLLMAAKDLAVIDDADVIPLRLPAIHRGRHVVIRHQPDRADPGLRKAFLSSNLDTASSGPCWPSSRRFRSPDHRWRRSTSTHGDCRARSFFCCWMPPDHMMIMAIIRRDLALLGRFADPAWLPLLASGRAVPRATTPM